MKIHLPSVLFVCFQFTVSAGFCEPVTPEEFSRDTQKFLENAADQTSGIIRQIQTEVAPANSTAVVDSSLELLGKSIASRIEEIREEELAEALGFEEARQKLLEYLNWYQNDAITNLGKAAETALSPTLLPADKKRINNGIFSSLVEQGGRHQDQYLVALKAIHTPEAVAAEMVPSQSAYYDLGKAAGVIVTAIIVFVLCLTFWLKVRKRSPNYQIERARTAARQQSGRNEKDPY
jgi:hypothetical protein